MKTPTSSSTGIAICGYGYRLPGGLENDDDVWKLFANRGFVQEPVENRYGKGEAPWDGFTNSPLKLASPYEGLIKDGKELEFDCALFGVSANDAKRMDPQIKMMLASTWDALQCAGMDMAKLHNSDTGVFVGSQSSAIASWKPPYGVQSPDVPGRSMSMIANRISYHFNWMGPSMSLATACSSGITALDAAIRALDSGECKMAAFGAVNHLGAVLSSIGFNHLGIISPTGSSRSFSNDANGYMRSEGAFMYILKRLPDAIRDGDKVFAVVRGCGLNTAGAEPDATPLTQGRMIVAPVQHAQETLMQRVLHRAGMERDDVSYIEAHATGTTVGDMVEGNAIAAVYGSSDRKAPLRLASTRSNMGHMEAASFTSSLLKVILMLQRRKFLPVSSHFKTPNPSIPMRTKKMRVQVECEQFPDDDGGDVKPITVGINSFGFGGANGHCLVQEYRGDRNQQWSSLPGGESEEKRFVIPLSAKTDEALVENARRLGERLFELEREPESQFNMYTLAANLSVRMTHHRVRTCFSAATVSELQTQLTAFVERADSQQLGKDEVSRLQHLGDGSQQQRVVMVFPGQGSQWKGCGRELYESELVFRRVVDAIDTEWIKLAGTKVSTVAFDSDADDLNFNACCWAQPVTFMLQVGLFELFRAHGIHATAVVGHSAGEAAAAYASGAYTLQEACRLVYHRSRLQEKLSGSGRMLVLMQDRASVEDLLVEYGFASRSEDRVDDVSIACVNSPNNTVVCGQAGMIARFREKLESSGKPSGKLIPGDIAFHSRHMMPIHDELFEVLDPLHDDESGQREAHTPMISTVTGMAEDPFSSSYWWRNMREPVNLIGAMDTVRKQVQPDVIIEISPHITLRSPIRDCYSAAGEDLPTYIYTLVRKCNSSLSLSDSIGRGFKSGLNVDFSKLYPRPQPITHLLNRYFFKPERMIDETLDSCAIIKREQFSSGPLLGRRIDGPNQMYRAVVSEKHFSWMAEHVVQGASIAPAAAYLELLFEAFDGEPIIVVCARIQAPLPITLDPRLLHTTLEPCQHAPHRFEFTISSCEHGQSDETTVHCSGIVEKLSADKRNMVVPMTTLESFLNASKLEPMYDSREGFYATMNSRLGDSFNYGPLFRSIVRVDRDMSDQALRVEISIDPEKWAQWDRMGYVFHPTLLDGVLQTFIIYVMECADYAGVPSSLENFVLIQKPVSGRITCLYRPGEFMTAEASQLGQLGPYATGDRSSGEVLIYDGVSGDLIAYLGNYISHMSTTSKADKERFKHALSWQPKDVCNVESDADGIRCPPEEVADIGLVTREMIQTIVAKAHPEESPFFANVAELCIGSPPAHRALESCCNAIADSPVQYTLISDDVDFLKRSYQMFSQGNQGSHLRFIENKGSYEEGFLRPSMFELLVVRLGATSDDASEKLRGAFRLVAPGWFLLMDRAATDLDQPADLECIWKSANMVLLRAPNKEVEDGATHKRKEAGVVIEDSLGFSQHWKTSLPNHAPEEIDFAEAHQWRQVDYFAMAPEDPNLIEGPAKLTEWVRQFAAQRSGVAVASEPCVFTVYTSGAVYDVTSPSQTGLWGAVRSFAAELGDACNVDFRLLDVATKEDLKLVHGLQQLRERELCVHNGRVWTSRLINIRKAMPVASLRAEDGQCFRLESNNSGLIGDIEFRTRQLPALGPDDVEISVKASALNFRDIMVGLGRLPLQSYERSALGRTVGFECAGVVTRIGSEVRKHRIGDNVVAMQGACIANRIQCRETSALRMPDSLTHAQGASVLSCYVTAYYSLVYLARMRKNQTILIHSAMGGVGQAAIALAKMTGARFYCTAGSNEKRAALRAMGCVDAFDSHSTAWYAALMEATNGRGVDIVLNSLAGEHVDLCLECLRPGGWHCEIGKVDIYANRNMKMSVFRKNIAYRGIDIDRLMMDDPELVIELAENCLDLLEQEEVPPLPVTEYSFGEYHEAMACMMNGKHRGKLVLVPPQVGEKLDVVDRSPLFGSGASGQPRTVLLSGCLGGFGLRVLAYVISMGAKHIVLLDRDRQRRRTEEWVRQHSWVDFLLPEESKDVRIEICRCDVSKEADVSDAFASIEKLGLPEVGSIFHLAGVLDDKPIESIDRNSFAKVYAPKANGALNLHRASRGIKTVEHFVLLSSTSSVFGNAGQVNYSAANSFLDGLAAMRKQNGLPAVSYCMGGVLEAGMAARNPQLLQMMKANGMPAISCLSAIEGLDAALRSGEHVHAVASLAGELAADFGSSDFLRTTASLVSNSAAFKLEGGGALSKDAIIDIVAERVAALCGVEAVDPLEPFSSYGLNSISVAELSAFLKSELSHPTSAMELMTSATCASIAESIMAKQEIETSGSDKRRILMENTAHHDGEAGKQLPLLKSSKQKPSPFEPALQEHFTSPLESILTPASPGVRQGLKPVSKGDENLNDMATCETSHTTDSHTTDSLPSIQSDLLPLPCRVALDELLGYVDTLVSDDLPPAVPVQGIKRVVLTGATGFMGRHFLAALLTCETHFIEKIFCPVRARDDSAALERVVVAMKEANLWNESFRQRIVAFSADLKKEDFGISKESYSELAGAVDAVYHFASSLNLSASFDQMKDENCRAMKAVIRLCLSVRGKHLFHASTLGIFPQYFAMFSNEMASKRIEHDAMPDMTLMKRVCPLSISGYVWSKLLNELAAMELASYIPLAIFRLPVMFANSRTGFTVSQDPNIRLFLAASQTGMFPGRMRPFSLEDADVCNTIMLRVSLNPRRQNMIYHCSRQSTCLPTESSPMSMLGFQCKATSYKSFKAECLKLGDESPLHTYWMLSDHFADYWWNYDTAARIFLIDISSVEEDCHPLPKPSNAIKTFEASLDWVMKNPKSWPFKVDLFHASVDVETILEPARELCKKYQLDFDDVVPAPVVEGLSRICSEVQTTISMHMRPTVAFNLSSKLESRINLHKLLEMHPEIKEEQIQTPLFIVGLNRTGTTFLHRLLDSSGCFETPRLEDMVVLPKAEELADPSPATTKERLDVVDSMIEDIATRAKGIHEIAVGLAEEDMCAHSCSLASLEFDVLFGLPEYRKWVDGQSLLSVYKFHKLWMQFLQWSRRRRSGGAQLTNEPLRWCFKLPWHARSLGALLQVYPDALLVHTHRAPEQVAGSWCSLVEKQRERFVPDLDKAALGAEQLESIGHTLSGAMKFREEHPEFSDRWLDVQFTDLVAAAEVVAKQVIAHAGLTMDAQIEKRVVASIQESQRKRGQSKSQRHKYSASDYGISPEVFEQGVFQKYNDSCLNKAKMDAWC